MGILVTRPSPAGEQLVDRLRALGMAACHTPLIGIAPGRQLAQLPEATAALQRGDLLLAVSRHAVLHATEALRQAGREWPTAPRYAAIGHSTAQSLRAACHQPVIFPPAPETSEALLALPAIQQLRAQRALILRGNGGRDLIADALRARGVSVTLCECYRRVAIAHPADELYARWRQQKVSTLVVTSGEMLQQLYDLVPEYDRRRWLLGCRLIVVSERLAQRARDLGWQEIRVADSANNDALLRTLQIN
ncbi:MULTISPECIES: uroporphyrinogen-III synthase [Edwardsiella]|uniref:Uroporphyrinogen-III synthase n=2 Tax=Edwardsiella anguillarum TaxID=1821960 RepID=A0A076LRT9_9GAMM|nr:MULTISPECIES: uroporphyrinogen-III synthase [Edwardsiella]AKM46313.1 uroporphyrinogen-III synthase [Edwardsiella sp. EA181011]GAJ67956.1 uroporphyrinogen-III synthase [Edwardsiella piscicida]AIJ08324.1 Uroporphyrinogen-III synthase [Edwardsiella anguillarum ET080813]KAB0591613.1 uroporphyrinogen-III synthase [Edwardsiella anguillarum]RFT04099.1 uroporphyrinogen-III synthase [Edwardsiella anguillarum]